jgi:CheY-like chemotaxis protein
MIPNRPFVVLLVEDEPADAHLVKVALRESRLLVDLHIACDGVEAMQFLRREGELSDKPRPDLILLDLNMPRMDGREFLSVIKADQALCEIPVVVLTTSDVERDVVSAYQLCAASFITKPVDMDQFTSAIRGLGDYWFALVRLPKSGA